MPYIALTDHDWYTQLLAQTPDEVNFWRPSGASFKACAPGDWFFFRLKKPHYAICGFGRFARYVQLPAWLAWDAFGRKNGVRSHDELVARIDHYRRRNRVEPEAMPVIGCIIIAEPTFFPEHLWVREPAGFHRNIVTGKGMDPADPETRRVLMDCLRNRDRLEPLQQPGLAATPADQLALLDPKGRPVAGGYGAPTTSRPRLGQGAFKAIVVDAYQRACAVSREHSLPVLDAAHIRPYADVQTHDVRNGVLLRSDIHRLYDQGYVTITPDLDFVVSGALQADYGNGKLYRSYEGRIELPRHRDDHPDREALAWHADTRFRGR